MRRTKVDVLVVENIRALIAARKLNDEDVAFAVGHSAPWLSKILSYDRQIKLKDLDRLAEFFGLTASELVSHGISALTERRRAERRVGHDRRSGIDRRKSADRSRSETVSPFSQREHHETATDRIKVGCVLAVLGLKWALSATWMLA